MRRPLFGTLTLVCIFVYLLETVWIWYCTVMYAPRSARGKVVGRWKVLRRGEVVFAGWGIAWNVNDPDQRRIIMRCNGSTDFGTHRILFP